MTVGGVEAAGGVAKPTVRRVIRSSCACIKRVHVLGRTVTITAVLRRLFRLGGCHKRNTSERDHDDDENEPQEGPPNWGSYRQVHGYDCIFVKVVFHFFLFKL